MAKTKAKITTDNREWIRRLRLIDDEFMNICFTDPRCVKLGFWQRGRAV